MINYPSGIRRKAAATKSPTKTIFANRGMSFEAEINATNDYYLAHGIAVVHKKPTPIRVVRVDYPERKHAKIVEAYYQEPSTTDYSGVYRGYYLDFEAKETQLKTAFPLKNFHQHQIEHMKAVLAQDGLAFVLLRFAKLDESYYLRASFLTDFYDAHDGASSMPIALIREQGELLPTQQIPRLPYIDIINKQIGGDSYR